MSILNVTPDSFSDGGAYNSVDEAVATAIEHVEAGADIIDIGGVSTRPGSSHVTEQEELDRVLPVIQGIRNKGCQAAISVDTYRASVAQASIQAGATIINDISGGMHDPEMLSTVARLDVPFVLMHMRGKPEEVNQKQHQQYENADVVGGVRKELAEAVRKALNAGIKRWNIILDPGIGFSKDLQGNLALLKDLPAVTGRRSPRFTTFSHADPDAFTSIDEDADLLKGFPVLVGVSRKGFIGKITGQQTPKDREYANSAIHALAIANGASILRVHDVSAARDAARITDAIYNKS
jgi:dihydropteroate synthase